MNLHHCVLILPVVVRVEGTSWPDRLDYLRELIHLGPVSSIESAVVPKVDIGPVGQKQLYNILEAKASCIV